MPAWNNGLSAIILKLNPAQIPPKKINKQKKHLSHSQAYVQYIIEQGEQ